MLNEREFTRCKISIFPSVYVGRFSSVNVTKPQETADLVTFTEEILIGNFNASLHLPRMLVLIQG